MTGKPHNSRLARVLTCAVVFAAAAPAFAQVDTNAENQQFNFAYALVQRGDFKGAAEALDGYLDKFSKGEKRGDVLYLRGYVAWRQGQPTVGLKFLADDADMTKIQPWKRLFLRGRINAELKQYKEALGALEAIKTDGLDAADKAWVLYEVGLAYFQTNNFTAAHGPLRIASELKSPQQADALLLLGKTLAKLEKRGEAMAALDACLALGNTAAEAHAAYVAGGLSDEAAQYDKAVKYYTVILSRHQSSDLFTPVILKAMWAMLMAENYNDLLIHFEQYKAKLDLKDRAEAWFLAGRAFQLQGKHEQAAGLYSAVAATRTQSAIEDQLLYRLAQCQFELGDYEKVHATLDRLVQDHASSRFIISADFMRYQADLKRHDATRAAARLTTIIGKGADHAYYATALLERARLYLREGKLDPATKDYEAWIKLAEQADAKPAGLPQVLAELHDLYFHLDQFDAAEKLADRLLNTPNLPPLLEQQTLFRHAMVLIKTRRFDHAMRTLKDLNERHPQNAFIGQVHYYRGVLLMADQKPDEAASALQAALGDEKLPTKLRAQALLLISVRQRERKEDDNAAATLLALEKVIGRDRMRDDDLLWLARYYIDREARTAGGFLTSLLDGRRKLEERTKAIAVFLLGRALQADGKVDKAIEMFSEVVALGHGYGRHAMLEIARCHASAGRRDEALNAYRGLMIAKDAQIAGTAIFEAADVHRRLAAQKEAIGDTAGASDEYKEAYNLYYRLTVLYGFKELSPLPELSHLHRAELAGRIGKEDDAARSLAELRQRFADTPFAQYADAVELIGQKKAAEAATLLRKLRQQELDPRLAARVHGKLRELEGGS